MKMSDMVALLEVTPGAVPALRHLLRVNHIDLDLVDPEHRNNITDALGTLLDCFPDEDEEEILEAVIDRARCIVAT